MAMRTSRWAFGMCTPGIGLVDLDAPAELIAGEISSMRVFAGYAGWGSDQLEAEIDEGSWFVVDAELADLSSDGSGAPVGAGAPPTASPTGGRCDVSRGPLAELTV